MWARPRRATQNGSSYMRASHLPSQLDQYVRCYGAALRLRSVDHAAKFDEAAVPGPLDDAAMMEGDGRVDQVAAQSAQARENAILVRTREAAVADNVRNQNRCNLPGLAHGAPPGPCRLSRNREDRAFIWCSRLSRGQTGLSRQVETRHRAHFLRAAHRMRRAVLRQARLGDREDAGRDRLDVARTKSEH
jgi:hypothetical protein